MEAQVAKMKEAFEKPLKKWAEVPMYKLTSCIQALNSHTAIKSLKWRKSGCENWPSFRTTDKRGGSDANVIAGNGIPTVNLAVGYEDIHTKNEKMPIEELVKTAEMVLAIIEETTNPS